jgi:hypothetical protein
MQLYCIFPLWRVVNLRGMLGIKDSCRKITFCILFQAFRTVSMLRLEKWQSNVKDQTHMSKLRSVVYQMERKTKDQHCFFRYRKKDMQTGKNVRSVESLPLNPVKGLCHQTESHESGIVLKGLVRTWDAWYLKYFKVSLQFFIGIWSSYT